MAESLLEEVPDADRDSEELELIKQIKDQRAYDRKRRLRKELERITSANENPLEEDDKDAAAGAGGVGGGSGLPGRWRELEPSPETAQEKE